MGHAVPRRTQVPRAASRGIESMISTAAPTGREAFAERMMRSANGAFEVATAYLGLHLGLYRSLAEDGPATPAELAARTGTNERLIREWLEQQAATEVLEATREG